MQPSKQGFLFALVAMACSAAFMIPWKLASHLGSSADMVFILCLVAAIFSSLSLITSRGLKAFTKAPSKLEWTLSLVFALFTILGNEASALSVGFLSPAVVSSLMRFELLFISLIAWLSLGENLNLSFGLGLLIALSGFYFMQLQAPVGDQWWIGALYAVTAAFIFAVMAVITRAKIHQIEPSRVNALRLWLSLIAWLAIHRTLPNFSQWQLNFFLWVSLAAILGPGLGRLAFMYSSRYIEARYTAMVISLSPVMALLLAWLFLNDIPSGHEILGGCLIMIATPVAIFWKTKAIRT